MATPPSLMQLSFAAGLDESQEDEVLDPMSGFPVLQNGRWDRRGGYSKRPGYEGLGNVYFDGSARSAGRRLLMNGTQLCTIDGTNLDVYSETAQRSSVRDRVPEASVSLREAPGMGMNSSCEDAVAVPGYVGFSYAIIVSQNLITGAINGKHGFVLTDAATGAIIRGPEIIDGSSDMKDVRLASQGYYILAFTCDAATSEVRVKYLDTSTAAGIAFGWHTQGTYSGFNQGFDVGNCKSGDRVSMAYVSLIVGPVGQITVRTLNVMATLDSVDIPTTDAVLGASTVALSEDGDTLWLAYIDGDDVKVLGLDPANLAATVATVATVTTMGVGQSAFDVYVCARSTGKAAVYFNAVSGTAHKFALYTMFQGILTAFGSAGSDGFLTTVGGSLMKSRPFLRDGRVYAHYDSGGLGAEGVLCDCTPPSVAEVPYRRPVAVALQRGLSGSSNTGRRRTVALDANRCMIPLYVAEGGGASATRLAIYDFADPYRWRPMQLNGSTYLGGGVTSIFDGSKVFESGFLVAPPKPQTDITTGSGRSLTNGRRYVATYEHVDADGNWHVSGVSAPSPISGPQTSKDLIVRVPPCSITSRGERTAADFQGQSLHIVLYATLDSNVGEEPYYRVGSIINDPDLPLAEFTDLLVDQDLATQRLLYGTGNLPGTGASQDHRAPPGLTHIVSYNGMLVGALGKTVFWQSQPIDGEGQWWSPLFSLIVDDDVTGLAVQDGTVLIFTRGGVWLTQGDPPSDNGFQGGLGPPRRLAIELGCINASSIVATSLGVFYQSDRGIELLGRSGGIDWIGENVLRTLAAFPVITSAVRDILNNTFVRFTLAEALSDGVVSGHGRDLIYDVSMRAWVSVDDKRGQIPHEAAQDAAYIYAQGAWRYGWLGADGTVHYERAPSDAQAHLDGNSFVTMVAETASFKASGIQGRQALNRLLVLSRKVTNHNLKVSLSYNHETTFRAARVFTDAEITALLTAGWPITQLKHEPHDDAECQAFRVRLEDAVPDGDSPTLGNGAGATWLALTMDVTPIPGAFEVPEGAT